MPGRKGLAVVLFALLIGAGGVGYGAFLALRAPGVPARARSFSGKGAPSFPPGAGRMAFVRSTPVLESGFYQRESADIYVMNAEGTGVRRLTHADPYMSNDQPTWSPDGTEIAFVNRWNARGGSILVMRADGTHVRRSRRSSRRCCPRPARRPSPGWSPER